MSSFQAEEFPILCETCLGDNPYLRMTKENYAKACKICDRPFTVFRWRPGPRSRFKKTEICGTCAKLKNVCQTCILDLQYGLPVQVRDEAIIKQDETTILNKDKLPVSHTNRNYMYEQLEQQVGLGTNNNNSSLQLPYNNDNNNNNPMLERIKRKGPYYKRNLPHICSFYVRGICNRGDSCPYRHTHPDKEKQDETLKDQNIKDRFYGVNDPVANKLLKKYNQWTNGVSTTSSSSSSNKRAIPTPPIDTAIRTLFIGGIDWSINQDLIKNKFINYGEITSINLLHDRKCGFITFESRESAEKAITSLFDLLYLNKKKCELNWARSKPKQNGNDNDKPENNEEAKEEKNNNTKTNNDDVNDVNDVNNAAITREEKEYLAKKGILPPKLPPMADPCATSNTGYHGTTTTKYKSMTTHYQESKV